MGELLLPVNITTPVAWKRHWARRVGRTDGIITAAFCPTAWMFGFEIIWGYGKGLGLALGPIWLGAAVARPTPSTEAMTQEVEG